ncbi:MAG: PrsW family intramembrane metalloprotease, partial [Actinomycetia bacterium]|nr:PrsW family intramembrane metalloprotease [Actinomycetes bacterium]
GIVWTINENIGRWGSQPIGLLASTIVWLLYGVFIGWILYHLQLFKRRPASAVAAGLLWGGFVAGAGSIIGGVGFDSLIAKWYGTEFASAWSSAIRAPLMEEGLKILGVIALALIPRVRFSSVLDGLFYGAIVGLGFTVTENIIYTNVSLTASGGVDVVGSIAAVMLSRGILGAMVGHMVLTGITGAGIGYFVSRRGKPLLRRVIPAVGLFLVGAFFHFLQNSPILNSLGFMSLFAKGIPALIVFLIVAKWGRREERKHFYAIAQSLDQAVISQEELPELATRRTRRRSRKRSGDRGRTKDLQRAQLRLLNAVDAYGLESSEATEAAVLVESVR